jgi:hypothetical protein
METNGLKDTIERINSLEGEKQSLLLEIEGLKKTADEKANALESEVYALRDELKAISLLMGGPKQTVERKLFKK